MWVQGTPCPFLARKGQGDGRKELFNTLLVADILSVVLMLDSLRNVGTLLVYRSSDKLIRGVVMDNIESLLQELTNAYGPSGFEGPVRSIMQRELSFLCSNVETDGIEIGRAHV